MEKLQEIYYSPTNLWTGEKAMKKLRKSTGLSPKVIKEWLNRQALYQVHLPAPKEVNRPSL